MGKVLVTGGLGFIGSNLVPRLQSVGYEVGVFDNGSRCHASVPEDTAYELIIGDVTDRAALGSAMKDVDVVIHLAAWGSVVESVKAPEDNFHPNVEGTFKVLDAARENGVTRVIFASTGGALIGESDPPVDEHSLPKPISPYGASKLCGEAYCHAFGKAFGLETVALRFGNVYGPCSAHKKGAVTAFIKAVAHDRPMVIYGDGMASRDFLYVDDLCQGIEKAVDADVASGSVFHLASGFETRIKDLAEAVAAAGGKPAHEIDYRPARPAEVSRNFARYDLARECLGFEPEWSLTDGLGATWRWFREQGESAFLMEESDA